MLPEPEEEIARLLSEYNKRLSHLETLEGAGAVDIGARAFNSANISVANNALVVLTFDSERFDTDNIHSLILNTGRLTATTAGKYQITGNVTWAPNATGERAVLIRLNGVTRIGGVAKRPTVAVSNYEQIATTLWDMAATDYVELVVFQDSGGALNVLNSNSESPEFMMQKTG